MYSVARSRISHRTNESCKPDDNICYSKSIQHNGVMIQEPGAGCMVHV